MLNRVDKRSQMECLKACGKLLAQGAPVLFFPEGTRSTSRCEEPRLGGTDTRSVMFAVTVP